MTRHARRSLLLLLAATIAVVAVALASRTASAVAAVTAPVLTGTPPPATASPTATFAWTDAEPGVTFQCSVENGPWQPCTSPSTYALTTTNNGVHQFAVRAVDAAGNVSVAAAYSFKYDPTAQMPFTVTGTVAGLLLGVTQPLVVTLTNPSSTTAISVQSLTVAVTGSSSAACPATGNVTVQQSTVSSAAPVHIPAGGSVTLHSAAEGAPQILLVDLPTVDQDACKNVTFSLGYSGTAYAG